MALTEKLGNIADAIRGKTGKTEEMTLDQMVTEIAGISGGGGSLDALIDKSITEVNSNVSSVGAYAFRSCQSLLSVSMPNVVTVDERGFEDCININSFYLPNVETVGSYAFSTVQFFIGELHFPKLKTAGTGAFQNMSTTKIIFPILSNVPGSMCWNNAKLAFADIGLVSSIGTSSFGNAKLLKTLVIRKTDGVCALSNVNAFNGTPFASSGTGGTLYVPQSLIEQYQTATNWSTLYAAGTCNFVAIEGSEYE